ncbi:transcriptional regulator [Streptomyces sp. AS58]|uniref:Helix-turn-helix transcriptional regulator n=1 Tax=Streptomyces cadmiisoli TaxID=2184053 RepID=A0A2Z4ISU2_9ACTN|nr:MULTISPECIES: LuxR C-terminal-related transcriptional regulator [Streptomyces]AWW36191.1 helix-turn-helix transcriptional regulator [Streptomyces cadmiisoli]KOV72062.1 transcriptional regulator [Streptomyces sp. AS58]
MTGRTTVRTAPRLYGRNSQLREVAALSDRLRTHSAVLVVTGEPGLGRTALLDHAARTFDAGPVLRVPTDRPRPPHDGVRALLRAAGGARPAPSAGSTPQALLETLRAAAGTAALLVCVDDVHLWDAPSRAALGRAARSLHTAGRVGLLLSVCGHRPLDPDLAALPVLGLPPLPVSDAGELLDEATCAALAPALREELLEEAAGNPALLLALARRLSTAEPRGRRLPPRPLADAGVLASVVGDRLSGAWSDADGLPLTVAAALRAADHDDVDAGPVLAATGRADGTPGPQAPRSEVLVLADGRYRFGSDLVRRAVYAAAPPGRRRRAHRALAAVHEAGGHRLPALLHRAWAATGSAPRIATGLAAAAADTTVPASHRLRAVALTRAAELTAPNGPRADRYTAAAEQALLAGSPGHALRSLARAPLDTAPPVVRGRAQFVRGLADRYDGPVADAHASLLSAAGLLAADAPGRSAAAALAAADAAWTAGRMTECQEALGGIQEDPAGPGADRTRDYRLGMRAVLEARFDRAAAPLRRVVGDAAADDEPEVLLRSASAALLLGDLPSAGRAGARALAAARDRGSGAFEPRALEYLAYAELRAGCHALARTHAEAGLRAATATGQRNTAAHHHAVLALAASIEAETSVVAAHVGAALTTARRHGLAQAATLAHWAAARADLGRGRPLEAAERLGPLVRPGPRRGHFAVWMLAVPCYVEAAALAARPQDAPEALESFAVWAGLGADPQAPAQLLRCRALLAAPEAADDLYLRALDLHDGTAGDFERARTELAYGKWLRRRRRLREARDRLGAALVGFERCGAGVWAQQARGELRALGAAPNTAGTGALARLTPQQWRVARHVADGATNREVARSLSVSTRTIDYHLRNVFALLGVRSRVELARLVGQAEKSGAHP